MDDLTEKMFDSFFSRVDAGELIPMPEDKPPNIRRCPECKKRLSVVVSKALEDYSTDPVCPHCGETIMIFAK